MSGRWHHRRWAARSYLWLLSLARGGHQDAAEMAHDAERLLAAAAGSGARGVAATWLTLVWDLFAAGLRHDVAQGVRTLVRAPGYTLAVSLVLAAGVAATTTLFAIVNAVLLQPLPYDAPDRLVIVWESSTAHGRTSEGPAPGNVADWVARNDVFDALSAWMTTSMTLRGRDGAAPVTGVQVTRGFFDVFRSQPLLGRTFTADEYDGAGWNVANRFIGREPIVVLAHRLWRELGGDPAIVGTSIHVEGREWRVLGVMPPEFAMPDADVAFWTPWDMAVSYRGERFPYGPPRDFRFLRVAGRLKPGLTIERAAPRMEMLAAQLAAEHPSMNAGWSVRLEPLAAYVTRTSRTGLLLVFGAVFCLLLLVCANVSSLTVARAAARTRELAIRMALGAGRARIARQLVAESALLAILSTAAALLLSAWWLDAATSLAPAGIPRLHEVRMEGAVVLFAAALALLVTVLSGVLPAVHGGATRVAPTLRDGAQAPSVTPTRTRRALVAGELAAAMMLLAGAALLVRTLVALQRVDPGFDQRNLLVMRITPDADRYRNGAQTADYYRRVLDALARVPAVSSAAAVTVLPMSTVGIDFDRPYWREGPRPPGDSVDEADIRMATPGYFATLRRPLARGREFSDRDTIDRPRVVIVNETLARRNWPGEDPVGRSLVLDYQRGAYPYEIVGVVADARYYGPRSEPRPEIFIPHAQNPYLVMNVIARTALHPLAVAETARGAALRVDPDQPVHSVTTMERLIAESVAEDRFATLLLSAFAIAGVIVATTGVYALLAFSVAQRRREIAVRIAVGATPRSVRRLVLGESMMLAGAGAAVGLAAAVGAGHGAAALLYGVPPHDPLTLTVTGALLVAIVLAASWIPARRAAGTNPVTSLR